MSSASKLCCPGAILLHLLKYIGLYKHVLNTERKLSSLNLKGIIAVLCKQGKIQDLRAKGVTVEKEKKDSSCQNIPEQLYRANILFLEEKPTS